MIHKGDQNEQKQTEDRRIRIPIATILILSFVIIIIMISAIFSGIAVVLINNHIKSDAQEQVLADLADARELYFKRIDEIRGVVRSAADRSSVEEAILFGEIKTATDELTGVRILEALDYLTIVDDAGNVIYRSTNAEVFGVADIHSRLVANAIQYQLPAAATTLVDLDQLGTESPQMGRQLSTHLDSIFMINEQLDKNYSSGMVIAAAAPVFDSDNTIIGGLYGGLLLNANQEFVCDIKKDLFRNSVYDGFDIGFVTIYQDDIGIIACPYNLRGNAAIGSRFDEDVFDQVIEKGNPTVSRQMVMGGWYITASQPIWNLDYDTIGILQVGNLEQRYLDIRDQIVVAFLSVSFFSALAAVLFAYIISQRISRPLHQLVSASRMVADGDLETRVASKSVAGDELIELANAFNKMALALQERDQELRRLTRHRIERSERLAIIGKLAANVAHELNNPLQGIVTFSHLMLEQMTADDPNLSHVNVIVAQANRCRDIIRGLLDFSRQRGPNKTIIEVNAILQDCIVLLANQAFFHNVEIAQDLDLDLPPVTADPSQIERVFLNLLINAAEAMDGSGRLTLQTRVDHIDQMVSIDISDTGKGISQHDLKRIFDPFYTTKEVGKGTGLGLAISYGITIEHGGTITVQSIEGEGTTFTVSLPLLAEE